jgi:hypothetical protein
LGEKPCVFFKSKDSRGKIRSIVMLQDDDLSGIANALFDDHHGRNEL